VVNVLQPGAGINADPTAIDTKSIQTYTQGAQELHGVDFIMNIIPTTVIDAFAKGDILQVLLFSVLFGAALSHLGERGRPVVEWIDTIGHGLFGVVGIIMRLAPLGAFGAMAFTIGTYGLGTLLSLGKLMAGVYLTSFVFVFVVLGLIAHLTGFSLWRFLVYIKEEIVLVLGTSSSESALPGLINKLTLAGAGRPVVGLVVPTGYSFNLDGTSIYLTMAAIFIAQAFNINLGLGEQLGIMALLLLTSKGAAAVTGGGFITLAATLSSTHVPVEGLALLLGVDRFMSESRAITNLIGNGVATLVIARWEKQLDWGRLRIALAGGELPPLTDEAPWSTVDVEPHDLGPSPLAAPLKNGKAIVPQHDEVVG
jgi:aerobic C4-dicarboxylate transport protein